MSEIAVIAIPLIITFLVVGGLIYWIVKIFTPAKPMLCPHCGTQAKPKLKTKGTIGIEIILWLCFFVPGLIYSIWRLSSRFSACPACLQPGMIPLDSPRASQILAGKP